MLEYFCSDTERTPFSLAYDVINCDYCYLSFRIALFLSIHSFQKSGSQNGLTNVWELYEQQLFRLFGKIALLKAAMVEWAA